jgi:hypothetical protein
MKADAPRRRRTRQEALDPELEALIKADAGKGVSTKLTDNAFWLDDNNMEWYEALEAIDKRGDKTELLTLLRTRDLPCEIGIHLANLLERYDLTRKNRPGRPPTPSYDLSGPEAMLKLAVNAVRTRVLDGMPVSKAIAEVASHSSYGITDEKLGNAYDDRRGSTRRMNRRMRPKR